MQPSDTSSTQYNANTLCLSLTHTHACCLLSPLFTNSLLCSVFTTYSLPFISHSRYVSIDVCSFVCMCVCHFCVCSFSRWSDVSCVLCDNLSVHTRAATNSAKANLRDGYERTNNSNNNRLTTTDETEKSTNVHIYSFIVIIINKRVCVWFLWLLPIL